MKYLKLCTLTLLMLLSNISVAGLINGNFSTGDLTGWTASAVGQTNNPTSPAPFISTPIPNSVSFDTGEFSDGLFIATLEQTFLVDALQPLLIFDFNLPSITADTSGSGSSFFEDAFFASIETPTDFFELLLIDSSGPLVDPFGTAPGNITLGISSDSAFAHTLTVDLTALAGTEVTLLFDFFNEDDGFQSTFNLSNVHTQSSSELRPIPEPNSLLMFGLGLFAMFLCIRIFSFKPLKINHINRQTSCINNASSNQILTTFIIATLIVFLFPTTSQAEDINSSSLVSVENQTNINFSGIFYNRRTKQSKTNASIENSSSNAINTPLILVIESTNNASVTVDNADGIILPGGKPYFNFSDQVAGDVLSPSELSQTRPVIFNNPQRRRFNIEAKVYQVSALPLTSAVTLEIPADDLGRKLIGAPNGRTLTVRAEGSAPVIINLSQQSQRGTIFFGNSGSSNTATVTTSGGANNIATIALRGDIDNPSAFHGDLDIIASVNGTEMSRESATVIRMAIDLQASTLLNDAPVIRTLTTIPATSGLPISFNFARGIMQEDLGIPIPQAGTNLTANITPLSGTELVTDSNGLASFTMQAGPGGQGWAFGSASLGSIGASTDIDPDSINPHKKPPCDCDTATTPTDSNDSGDNSVAIYSGEKHLNNTDLSIPGRGFGYQFNRTYRSQSSHLRSVATNDFGVDWAFSYSDNRLIKDNNNIIVFSDKLRTDVFVATADPSIFLSPIEYYEQLTINSNGTIDIRNQSGRVYRYAGFNTPLIAGRLIRIEDRNNNFMSFLYDSPQGLSKTVLTTVVDTLGRNIQYHYFDNNETNTGRRGRLHFIEDFRRGNSVTGRQIQFDYDDEGNLVSVTSPIVANTPNGNDFPQGKTTRYSYTKEVDIPASITGINRARLLHNLRSIAYPNEVAANSNTARELISYGEDPNDSDSFDRALSYSIGGTNTTGVEAGGTINYQYQKIAANSITPNDPYTQVNVTDRRGNQTEYIFSAWGTELEKKELTRGFRGNEPQAFITRNSYNLDKELIQTILPLNNSQENTYDRQNNDRFQQGNITRREQLPDTRGGDQTALFSQIVYEPIYQQASAITDSRGIDSAFTAPIADSCGRSQIERYTSHNFFDYQEAAANLILPLLAEELKTSIANVQARLATAGIQLGLGDLNGDGITPVRIAGNVIRTEKPAVSLLASSNQSGIEGDTCQEITTLMRYNDFGQTTSTVDAEGNVNTYSYFPENDPDGDNSNTPASADNRTLETNAGGYLSIQVADTQANASRNNHTNPAPVNITSRYRYDDVGNKTSITDGRGIATEFFVNELNQVIQTQRAADVSASSNSNPVEPIGLMAFAYINRVFYDFNNNIIQQEVEDRGNTSQTGGFVETLYRYDILDNQIEVSQEVGGATANLVTQYRYDANENKTLSIQPEGNADSYLYDERDLLFQSTRGANTASTETLGVSASTFNPRGGTASTQTQNYDFNQNLIEQVDASDTDNSTANNSQIAGIGDTSVFIYDGFDRRVSSIDAIGNKTSVQYDPVSNIIQQSVFGPIGGSSPLNSSGTANVLLSQTEIQHDELNRKFQQDQLLFVSNGINTVRAAAISDSDLTPNDNKVSQRYEFDKNSRQTFSIQDDLDRYRTDYDGANRKLSTLDPEGNLVEYAYDDNSNVIETRETDVAQVAGVADEIFLSTMFYDSLNRVQQQVDNIGQSQYFRYDSRNNQVAMADAEGPVNSSISRRSFAGGGLTINNTNSFGNVTVVSYDGINRKLREDRVLTASGQGDGINSGADIFGVKNTLPTADASQSNDGLITVQYTWDDNSLLFSLTDDNGNQSQYGYDNLNRRINETKGIVVAPALADRDDADTTIVTQYDADDNITALVDENGSTRTCQYDGINRRIACSIDRAVNVTGTTAESYQYDGLSRRTLATDNNQPNDINDDSTLSYAYDSLSRVIEETQQRGNQTAKVISTAWLAENLRTGLTYPNNRQLLYSYDALDRLASISDQGANDAIVEYLYIGTSRVLQRLYPINGIRQTYLNDAGDTDIGYDGLRRTVQLRHLRNDDSLVVGFTHNYDRMNNKLNEDKLHDNSNSELYAYDSTYRLTAFERGELDLQGDNITLPSTNALQQQFWTLDGVGNWQANDTTEAGVNTNETREHSSFNELIQTANGSTVALDHDDNGNQIDDGELLFVWDYRNRLRTVNRKADNSLVAEYHYDAANRRNRKFVADGAVTTEYYYSAWQVLEELDGAGGLNQQYVYGIYIDEALVLDRNLDGGAGALDIGDQRLFYQQNALYSVFALTDFNGDVVEGYLYDAYGRQTALDSSNNVQVSVVDQFYGFTGRRLDDETGLMYFRNRYYEIEAGRFVGRDPLGYVDGMGLYVYVEDNPTNFNDPSGMLKCTCTPPPPGPTETCTSNWKDYGWFGKTHKTSCNGGTCSWAGTWWESDCGYGDSCSRHCNWKCTKITHRPIRSYNYYTYEWVRGSCWDNC